jgi:hypothetical protein
MNKSTGTTNLFSRKSSYGHEYSSTTQSNSLSMIDDFLESEKATNNTEQWCKLNKSVRLEKLTQFASEYATKNSFSPEDEVLLIQFFRDCLDKKKLNKVKDVVYNKVTGHITDVPLLVFNKTNKSFTLKKIVKNSTTLKVRSNSNTTEIAVNTKSTTEKIMDDIDRPEINDTSTI